MLHMQYLIRYVVLATTLAVAAAITACTPQAVQDPIPTSTRPGTLTPFYTATTSSTPTPVDRTTPSPLPSPTPTLRSHTITRGEDLGGIAFRYRVGLPALLEANPDVDPYFLVVGSTLNIPTSEEPVEQTPAPTPVAIQFSPVQCNPGRDGGAWCFVLATNPQSFDVESISAIIRVADEGADEVVSQIAVAPLDLLPAGSSIPLAAYFPPKIPNEPLQASAELLTSLPVFPDSARYLPVEVTELAINISESGMEAEVSGQVKGSDGEQEASLVWVAAVAYDQQGAVIGLRRWENQNSLPGGKEQPFTFWVYSTGPEIERVEVLAEARP
jgi:LysM repeat protein